ncbi:MAG: hypothetical protein LBD06_02375 [Candidatus Accumulibacter sp.]|nr:hypothetical protein [Accumulibacter sp.]
MNTVAVFCPLALSSGFSKLCLLERARFFHHTRRDSAANSSVFCLLKPLSSGTVFCHPKRLWFVRYP